MTTPIEPLEKRPLPEVIEADRVVLRRHRLELAEIMFSYIDKDRERLRRFLPWVDGTRTSANTRAYIHKTIDEWELGSLFDYGIYRQSDGLYMGSAGVHTISWENRRCEIGYWILGDFEGQGLMSESISAIESACFSLGFHRIEIRCSSLNSRSASVPKRLGYNLDGVMRGDVIENGQYRDTLVFGKLSESGLGAR